MRGLKTLTAAFLTTLLAASAAQAMEIQQYDKMASQDRSNYVSNLIVGTQRVLTDEGRADLADKMHTLFTGVPPGDEIALGMTEFTSNLDRARVADARRAEQDPNAHRLEVEDAMLVTLKKNDIPMLQDFVRGFRAIKSNFKPKYPSQKQ